MVAKQFFLCVLLSLTGCNHLVQYNMLPSNEPLLYSDAQTHPPALYIFNDSSRSSVTLLSYCVDLASFLNLRADIFEFFTFADGHLATTPRAAQDAADNAILSLDNLVKMVTYLLDPIPGNINLHTVRDIHYCANKVGLTLTHEFNTLCDTIRFATVWTPEAVTKLITAYAICAFRSAYRAHGVLINRLCSSIDCAFCSTYRAHRMLINTPCTSTTSRGTARPLSRIVAAVSKAFTAAAIAAIATHLSAVFIDEARADADNALTNAYAVRMLVKLADSAGVDLVSAVAITVVFVAYAAVDRTIRTSSTFTTFRIEPLHLINIAAVLATIAANFPNTDPVTGLSNALRAVPTYNLAFTLVKTVLAAHSVRAFFR